MKLSYLRFAAALTLGLGLAACGGKASFDVSGTITGLDYDGLVLSNNGENLPRPAFSNSFTFPTRIDYGSSYSIIIATVAQQPLHETCVVSNGSGSAGHTATIAATVTCLLNTFTIGGTVNGLPAGRSIVLANGSTGGTVTVTAPDPTAPVPFTFPAPVKYGVAYGVTVLPQTPPLAELRCDVQNGTGLMGDAAIATITVTCTP